MYTDTQRLNWLIDTGNYGYVDTWFWPGSKDEVRARIDKAMRDAFQPANAANAKPCALEDTCDKSQHDFCDQFCSDYRVAD